MRETAAMTHQPLYEIAVLTKYTSKPGNAGHRDDHTNLQPSVLTDIVGSETHLSELDSQTAHELTHPSNVFQQQSTACSEGPVTRTIEYAQSVSGYSTLDGLSSWTGNSYGSLWSSAGSIGHSWENLNKDDGIPEFDGIQYIPFPEDIDQLINICDPQIITTSPEDSYVTLPSAEESNAANNHIQTSNFEQALLRIAGDICTLPETGQDVSSAKEVSQSRSGSCIFHLSKQKSSDKVLASLSDVSESDFYKTAFSSFYDTDENKDNGFMSPNTCQSDEDSSYDSAETSAARTRGIESKYKAPKLTTEHENRMASTVPEYRTGDMFSDTRFLRKSSDVRMDSCGCETDTDSDQVSSTSHSDPMSNTGRNNPSTFRTSAWDSEVSALNPHSKPFYPKSYFTQSFLMHDNSAQQSNGEQVHKGGIQQSQNDPAGRKAHPNVTVICDSGINLSSDLTHYFNSTHNTTRSVNITGSFNDSGLPQATPAKNQFSNIDCWTNKSHYETAAHVFNTTETADLVYDCRVDHKDEFVPLEVFSIHHLPSKCQSKSNLDVILSIAQRIVRIRVRKPIKFDFVSDSIGNSLPPYSDPEDTEFDHYGTGFAFQINHEHLAIRTHSELVSSATEASKARVDLVLSINRFRQPLTVQCNGQYSGFETIPYSKTAVFRCSTPHVLLPFLHEFREIPMAHRNSLFNDSCYFTDSSPDTSATERKDLDTDVVPKSSSLIDNEDNETCTRKINVSLHPDNEKQDVQAAENLVNLDHDYAVDPLLNRSDNQPTHDEAATANNGCKISPYSSDDDEGIDIWLKGNTLELTDYQPEWMSSAKSKQGLISDIGHVGGQNIEISHTNDDDVDDDDEIIHNHEKSLVTPHDRSDEKVVDDNAFISNALNSFLTPHNAKTKNIHVLGDDCFEKEHIDTQCPNFLEDFDEESTPKGENPFSYCGVDEAVIRQAFESVIADETAPPTLFEGLDDWTDHASPFNPDGMPTVNKQIRTVSDGKLSSPLVIMERRFEDKKGAAEGDRICPYVGQNLFGNNGCYSNFASYAGDIFTSTAQQIFQSQKQSKQPLWEYETLVYAQNHYREEYNRLYRPVPLWNIPEAVGQEEMGVNKYSISQSRHGDSNDGSNNKNQSESDPRIKRINISNSQTLPNSSPKSSSLDCTKHHETMAVHSGYSFDPPEVADFNDCSNIMPLISSPKEEPTKLCRLWEEVLGDVTNSENYLKTWDRDLLNLDDKLNPLPEFGYFEKFVEQLLAEEDSPASSNCCCTNNIENIPISNKVRKPKCDKYAIIISHPHGDAKMISIGQFSQHYHVGGALYDTPTCMGSSGAPIIVLSEEEGGPYVTHFVHSGTIRVNGIRTGAGVVYFDKLSL